MSTSGWEPDQYHRFQAERQAPFFDLVGLAQPVAGGRVVDLGCGTGELTVELHARLGAAETVGIDLSQDMLDQAPAAGGVRFQHGDIGAFDEPGEWDAVFANASLHWVPDHPAVLARWARSLRPGGQLAVQVPANADHPSHRISQEMGGDLAPDPVLSVLKPEQYAELLDRLGFVDQHVRLQVYGHHLASTAEVVEWVKGTSLTRFRRALPPDEYERFVDEYRRRLIAELGDQRPYFYAFKRILFWGRAP